MPFDSYSPLTSGTRGNGVGGLKVMPDMHYYGCCACIGSAGIGLVPKMHLLTKKDGFVVNLFIDGVCKLCNMEKIEEYICPHTMGLYTNTSPENVKYINIDDAFPKFIYNSIKEGDTVLINLPKYNLSVVEVVNWHPTSEEKIKYKRPVKLKSAN